MGTATKEELIEALRAHLYKDARVVDAARMRSESGTHKLGGATVNIAKIDAGEPWDDPIIKVFHKMPGVYNPAWINGRDVVV